MSPLKCNWDNGIHLVDDQGRIWHVHTLDPNNITASLCKAWLESEIRKILKI